MPNLRDESKIKVTGYKGEFTASMDSKNRFTLPATLRKTPPKTKSRSKNTKDRFVITRGLDGGLALYPVTEWIKIEEKISEGSYTQPEARYFRRVLFGSAVEVVLDSQGRIPLSKLHQEISGIDKELIVVGNGTFIELWSPEKYNAYLGRPDMNFEDAAKNSNAEL